jgi:hypothetical protein
MFCCYFQSRLASIFDKVNLVFTLLCLYLQIGLIGACQMKFKNSFHGLELCFEELWNKSPYVGVMSLQSNKFHNFI